jgi:hypothetical protein
VYQVVIAYYEIMNYLISLFLHSSGVTEENQNNEYSNTDYSNLTPPEF